LKFPGAKIATDEFCSNMQNKPKHHITEQGMCERWYMTKLYS
jgi:hypothetical protein